MTMTHQFTVEKCVKIQKSRANNVIMCVNIHMKKCENHDQCDFDANIMIDMCKIVMYIFIDIKLRIADKYIHLYHAYCYLHHLCA